MWVAGSFYSRTKAYVEDMLKSYNHVLTLRVRPHFQIGSCALVAYFIGGPQVLVCGALLMCLETCKPESRKPVP